MRETLDDNLEEMALWEQQLAHCTPGCSNSDEEMSAISWVETWLSGPSA